MLLMHCLAEITQSRLVFNQPFIWNEGLDSKQYERIEYQRELPTLKDGYLILIDFDIKGLQKGIIGITWGATSVETASAPNRFSLIIDTGTWMVQQVVPGKQVKLFEKRGRLQTKKLRHVRIAMMALHGQYFFYINDMNTPLFQCYQHELSLPHGKPQLVVDSEATSVATHLKIWQLDSRMHGALSVEGLLQHEDGAY